jgi:L-iditol 2-dehydrogenase
MINRFMAEQMVFDSPGKLSLRTIALEAQMEGDAFFQTLFTTICGSDLRIISHGDSRIDEPRVLGHEVVARVLSPGYRKELSVGDFVAIGADIPCALCHFCLSGRENLCVEHVALGYQIDGGLSTLIRFPEKFLLNAPIVKINPKKHIEAYALSEPAGCVIHGVEFSNVQPHHRVLIIGGGPIGAMLAKVCQEAVGVPRDNISIVEPFESRREFLAAMQINVYSNLSELTISQESSFDRIFTATSNPESHTGILGYLSKGGRVNFFGGVPSNSSLLSIDANLLHYSEISLEGSHGSSPRHHRQAANLISMDEDFWAKLITLKVPLNSLPSAIERLRKGLEVKVAVYFNDI